MKATLEFEIPEDEYFFKLAVVSREMSLVLSNFDEYLRQRIKYQDNTEEIGDCLQCVRDKFNELLRDYHIDL